MEQKHLEYGQGSLSEEGLLQLRRSKDARAWSPEDLPDQVIEPVSPALAGRFFTSEPPGKPAISRPISNLIECVNG